MRRERDVKRGLGLHLKLNLTCICKQTRQNHDVSSSTWYFCHYVVHWPIPYSC